jgi:hypothetical protein
MGLYGRLVHVVLYSDGRFSKGGTRARLIARVELELGFRVGVRAGLIARMVLRARLIARVELGLGLELGLEQGWP